MKTKTKTCTHCGKTKDLSMFNRQKDCPDGFTKKCRSCQQAHYHATRSTERFVSEERAS